MFGTRRTRRPRRGNRPSGDYWDPVYEALVPGRDSGYYGHGDLGHMPGPEFYPNPYTGERDIGHNHDFGPSHGSHRSGQSNVANVSAISVMNDNGNLQVWRNGQLVTSRQSSRHGDRDGRGGGSSISVFNDNGRVQIFRDGELVASDGGGGRRSGRSGHRRRHRHHRRGPDGMDGGFYLFGLDIGDILPGIFRDSDFSDDSLNIGLRGRGGPTGQQGRGEGHFSGQRGPRTSGGSNTNSNNSGRRGPQSDGADFLGDDGEGDDEDVSVHQAQSARYSGGGRHASRRL